jgi:hypothetical protein
MWEFMRGVKKVELFLSEELGVRSEELLVNSEE